MRIFNMILGKVLSALFAIAAMVMLVGLWKLQLLPNVWLTALGAVMVLVLALIVFLTWTGKGKVKMTFGIILAVLGIVIQSFGSFYVWQTVNALRGFVPETETVVMVVYMRDGDVRKLSTDFAYGVVSEYDPEATAVIIEKINEDLGGEISCTEYENQATLLDALLREELDAMIIDPEFLNMLQGTVYEEKLAELREAGEYSIEIEIPVVEETPKDGETPENPDEQVEYIPLQDSFAVYISGIDARGGAVSIKSRSDVNIVAVINPNTKQVLLINTPRDYYVPISSPTPYLDGKNDKLTHAGNGGPEYSKKTLSNFYGIDIAYYFKVNFTGFVKIVDALDGITVQSEYDFRYTDDDGSVYYYQKGENQLSGKEALGFCRNRYSFASGDNQRGKNQMAVIKGVINKMLSPKLLTNYTQILDAVSGAMEMTVPLDLIGDLVSQQLTDGGSWNVVSYSVEGYGQYKSSPGAGGAEAYMMIPKEETVEKAKQLIQDLIDGKVVTP